MLTALTVVLFALPVSFLAAVVVRAILCRSSAPPPHDWEQDDRP